MTDLSSANSSAPPTPEREAEPDPPTAQDASDVSRSKDSRSKKRSRYKPRVKRRVTGIVPPNVSMISVDVACLFVPFCLCVC